MSQWYTVGKGRGNQRYVMTNNINQYDSVKGGGHNHYVHAQQQQQYQHPPAQQQQWQFQSQQQLQQHQQQQLWQPNHTGDWICAACGSLHPRFHKSCWTCEGLAATTTAAVAGQAKVLAKGGKAVGKGKGKGGKATTQQQQQQQQRSARRPGRWQRWKSGPGAPAHWKDNSTTNIDGDDEDMGEENYDIGTPKKDNMNDEIDQLQLQKVIGWLRAKGADSSVIGTITEIKEASRPSPPEVVKDPWRALQSWKDKLRSVSRQLADSDTNLEMLQKQYKEAQDWHDDLVDKRDDIQKEILQLQEVVGSSDLKQKVDVYEGVINQLREKLVNGVPETQQERNKVYNLVFNGHQGEAEEDKGNTGDDSEKYVDKQGFGFVGRDEGFGPAKSPKAAQSPYSKGPPLWQGKGPDGEAAGAPAAATSTAA